MTGYFRSWKTTGTGGEIGKIFYINHGEYKLERVRFKVNNQCDTCQVRLHIREVVDDLPGDEILYDSISTEIKRLSFDDRFSEFDLRPYNLVFKQQSILRAWKFCIVPEAEPLIVLFVLLEQKQENTCIKTAGMNLD